MSLVHSASPHTHRDAAPSVLAALTDVATLADKLINGGGLVNRGVGCGLVVVEKKDRSDPHYQLCVALETLAAVRKARTAVEVPSVGTSTCASDPIPSGPDGDRR